MMRLLAALFVLATSVWPCAAVLAQTPADDAIARGVQLRKQGKNAEALTEFQSAYALSPSPKARAQIALAEQALGRWVAAEAGIVQALAAADDAWIAKNQAALSQALATIRAHLGRLFIETDVAGASLFVAGQPVGTSPLTAAVRVVTGDVYVEARWSERETQGKLVNVATGGEARVRLTQAASSASAAPTAQPLGDTTRVDERPAGYVPGTGPEAVGELGGATGSQRGLGSAALAETPGAQASALARPANAESPAGPPDWTLQRPAVVDGASNGAGMRTGGVISLVAGGLLLGGAISAHVVREYHAGKLSDDSYCSKEFDCTRHYNTARTAQTFMIVGYAAAGAAVATGLMLLVLAPGERDARSVRVFPALAPHVGGVQLTASF